MPGCCAPSTPGWREGHCWADLQPAVNDGYIISIGSATSGSVMLGSAVQGVGSQATSPCGSLAAYGSIAGSHSGRATRDCLPSSREIQAKALDRRELSAGGPFPSPARGVMRSPTRQSARWVREQVNRISALGDASRLSRPEVSRTRFTTSRLLLARVAGKSLRAAIRPPSPREVAAERVDERTVLAAAAWPAFLELV